MSETITVRCCLNLSGLRFGEHADVDPDDPYIARLLEERILVPLDAAEPEAEAAPPPIIEEQELSGGADDAGAD